jgi:hypothetical protein
MATGPEHYAAGEQWLFKAEENIIGPKETVEFCAAVAQAHFTAALAAATALYDADLEGGDGEYQAWKEVAGTDWNPPAKSD